MGDRQPHGNVVQTDEGVHEAVVRCGRDRIELLLWVTNAECDIHPILPGRHLGAVNRLVMQYERVVAETGLIQHRQVVRVDLWNHCTVCWQGVELDRVLKDVIKCLHRLCVGDVAMLLFERTEEHLTNPEVHDPALIAVQSIGCTNLCALRFVVRYLALGLVPIACLDLLPELSHQPVRFFDMARLVTLRGIQLRHLGIDGRLEHIEQRRVLRQGVLVEEALQLHQLLIMSSFGSR